MNNTLTSGARRLAEARTLKRLERDIPVVERDIMWLQRYGNMRAALDTKDLLADMRAAARYLREKEQEGGHE